jgi:hypothetical protein
MLTRDTNSATIGYMDSDETRGPNSLESRLLTERIDELSRCVSNLISRAINIERQAGKQEEWYYR